MLGLTLFLFAIGTSRSSVTSSQTLTSLFQPWQASIVHIVLKQEPESQFREPTPWFRGENIRLIRLQLDITAPGRMTLHHRSLSRINVHSLVVCAKMWKHVNRGGLWQYEFAVCSTGLPSLTISTPFLQTTWKKIFLAHLLLPYKISCTAYWALATCQDMPWCRKTQPQLLPMTSHSKNDMA